MGVRDDLGRDLADRGRPGGLQTVSVQVVDVTESGRVNVDWGGALLTDVACTDAYRDRRAGDWVALRPGVRPVVLWRVGPDPGRDGDAATRALAAEAALDVQVVRSATWGTAAPTGMGWQEATTPWIRATNDGKIELYMQVGTQTAPPPSPPPSRPPSTVTVSSTGAYSWRGGRLTDSYYAAQGDPGGVGGPLRGAFFYYDVAAQCAGKTVASMQLTLWRVQDLGPSGGVTVRAYLHNYTDPPSGQLALGDGPQDLVRLSAGAKAHVSLPAAWAQALAAGTARGVAVYSPSSADYCELNGGDLTITFSS
ncbi:hypothetical protein [Streptomyces qinglanensis]|uniref:hypothetical protein n=1 Tax=Streptomyces qinglanensis TaxID=943816 RepID=UPI003D72FE61